jgi:hypothetical protein
MNAAAINGICGRFKCCLAFERCPKCGEPEKEQR